ncbi:Transposon Tf2-12 polyprotein [Mycena sanguinolenta]|uniref:Transposon Tf2-12 polyprotein n=1 Tax=Mycena sanguinolenta TaxID=230812 RepID=A0A8H6X9D4_9AGAR|nr:Transposon Tf2-12 polyprotein [Mycena sanguinolenta]
MLKKFKLVLMIATMIPFLLTSSLAVLCGSFGRNIKTTRPSDKLDHRRLGPYPIECAVGTRAFKLRLPSYLSRLHPVFHISLLEPYNDPSEFHPHADPQPFELLPDDDPATRVAAILDARKTGRRFEYLVHFTGASEDEDAWVPLSDIPRTADELLERFHRRHPRAPRPQRVVLEQTYPVETSNSISPSSTSTVDSLSVPDSVPPPPPRLSTSTPSAVPRASRRVPTPPPVRENLQSNYVPPTVTTTRFGRKSRPADRLDPIIKGREPRPP